MGDDEGQQQQAGGQEQTPAAQTERHPIPYERFVEVNTRLKESTTKLGEMEQMLKTLREESESRIKALEQERSSRERLEVAIGKGLPASFANRLQGSKREEWEADADELLTLLPAPGEQSGSKGPGVPPGGKGGNPAVDIGKLTPKQIREQRSEILKQSR